MHWMAVLMKHVLPRFESPSMPGGPDCHRLKGASGAVPASLLAAGSALEGTGRPVWLAGGGGVGLGGMVGVVGWVGERQDRAQTGGPRHPPTT